MALSYRQGRAKGRAKAAVLVFAMLVGSAAHASEAGTRITNVAVAHYDAGGVALSADSNAVALIVAERLDLTLVRPTGGPVTRGVATPVAIALTNTGNGQEAFVVQVTGATGAASVAIDRNGDGRYDPTTDTLLTDGRTPALAPGATLALVVVADTSAVAAGGTIAITATAATGTGAPGTVVAGGGDGGGDAVVGATGATATVAVPVPVDSGAPPTLVKTQTVVAPDGSSRPVRGAIVTYVLDAGFSAGADDAQVDDPIPTGTRYVAGSLRLDGTALPDAGDGSAIHVTLGPVPASVSHRIQFQVQIQ